MENDNLSFENNFSTIISNVQEDSSEQQITGESPSPVTTDGDNPEKILEEKVVSSETNAPEIKSDEPDPVDKNSPKMIPYDERALLKEISFSIKEISGIDITVSEDTEVDSFISNLTEKIVESEFSKQDSVLLERAKEIILEQNGIDDQVLAIATGIPYGIDRNEYMEYVTIKEFSEQEIDANDEESLRTLYATFHSIKGISPDDIESYVEADLDRNDQSLIEKRKDFLNKYAEDGLLGINERISSMKKAKSDFDSNRKKEINEVISSFLKDNEFTKEEIDSYINATTKKSEEIILPDGTKRAVTAFEKKKYEFSQKNLKEAVKENILFFLDKDQEKKVISENSKKSKEAGKLLNNYLKDIDHKEEFVVKPEEIEDGFTSVKSSL